MITAEQKPINEIREMITPFKKILVVGCGSCVAECAAGGEKETGMLASALRMAAKMEGSDAIIHEKSLDRQCVNEFVIQLDDIIGEYEAVLSLGCGAGVQAVAEMYQEVPIIPALNTEFLGETRNQGYWLENCLGCGDCMLFYFGGVFVAALLIAWEHNLVRPTDLSRLDAAFFTMNGIISMVVFLGTLGDRVL